NSASISSLRSAISFGITPARWMIVPNPFPPPAPVPSATYDLWYSEDDARKPDVMIPDFDPLIPRKPPRHAGESCNKRLPLAAAWGWRILAFVGYPTFHYHSAHSPFVSISKSEASPESSARKQRRPG